MPYGFGKLNERIPVILIVIIAIINRFLVLLFVRLLDISCI